MKNKLTCIFESLKKMYPDPKTELNYSTPFQLIVAVILSAQTTDKQVNKVTSKLFGSIKNPKDLLSFGAKKFEKAISGVNYYKTKSRNIWKLAEILVTPKPPLRGLQTSLPLRSLPPYQEGLIEELQELPGIGIKSAKVIAHVLWDLPVIAVDTHVHRVANRWGIVKTKTANQTSEKLENIVPQKYKDFAHHAMVLFGRYVCKSRKPECGTCKLKRWCDYYKTL